MFAKQFNGLSVSFLSQESAGSIDDSSNLTKRLTQDPLIHICHSHWHKQEINCCFTVRCLLSVTSFIICCLEILSIFIQQKRKRKKKKPHWRWEWLSLGWQLERLKYLLTDCFLAELHQLWHQPGTQRETLVSSIPSPSTASALHPVVGSEISR